MIASLSGVFQERLGDQIVIDVHGVGYLLTGTGAVLSRALKPGDSISVVVYTDVKENAISLYGFDSLMEREVFLLLKKVKGIGPKHALSVISALGAEGVLGVVGRGDLASLQSVPGIGRKTAERLLVELREFVGALAFDRPELESTPSNRKPTGLANTIGIQTIASSASSSTGDAILALEKLGFARDRARTAVERALKGIDGSADRIDAGELLRLSLGQLS